MVTAAAPVLLFICFARARVCVLCTIKHFRCTFMHGHTTHNTKLRLFFILHYNYLIIAAYKRTQNYIHTFIQLSVPCPENCPQFLFILEELNWRTCSCSTANSNLIGLFLLFLLRNWFSFCVIKRQSKSSRTIGTCPIPIKIHVSTRNNWVIYSKKIFRNSKSSGH